MSYSQFGVVKCGKGKADEVKHTLTVYGVGTMGRTENKSFFTGVDVKPGTKGFNK